VGIGREQYRARMAKFLPGQSDLRAGGHWPVHEKNLIECPRVSQKERKKRVVEIAKKLGVAIANE